MRADSAVAFVSDESEKAREEEVRQRQTTSVRSYIIEDHPILLISFFVSVYFSFHFIVLYFGHLHTVVIEASFPPCDGDKNRKP